MWITLPSSGQPDHRQLETSRSSPQLDQPFCANLTHHDHRGALHLCTSLGANGLDAYLVPRVSTHMRIGQVVRLHKAMLIMNLPSLLPRELSTGRYTACSLLQKSSYHGSSAVTCWCGTRTAVSYEQRHHLHRGGD
jgi:hypothetical protein